jgi:hypothetical protein
LVSKEVDNKEEKWDCCGIIKIRINERKKMNNEITKTTLRLNDNGDQVVDEQQDGGGKTQTIKYGLIRLMGEKQERRVSFKTLLAITKAKEDGIDSIMIRELNMTVKVSQIVMMRSETEKVRVGTNVTNLPTANVCLDLDIRLTNKLRPQFIRECEPYYEATVHYTEKNGERQYYLEFDKIKRLLKIDFDKDGYDYVSKIYEYGVEK